MNITLFLAWYIYIYLLSSLSAPPSLVLPSLWCARAVGVTSDAVRSPSLSEVISVVTHAYYIVREQREEYGKCVARQSLYCDADLASFEVDARNESIAALASTAATLEVSDEFFFCPIVVMIYSSILRSICKNKNNERSII